MITREDLVKLHGRGVNFMISRSRSDGRMGDIDEWDETIVLYPLNIDSLREYDRTIAHELIHAAEPKYGEMRVELSSKILAFTNPKVIEFAKELFNIPEYVGPNGQDKSLQIPKIKPNQKL